MFTLQVDQDIELHVFQPHQANELFQLVNQNRHHLQTWLPWVEGIISPHQAHLIIINWLRQLEGKNGFNAGIRYKGVLVGGIGFHQTDWYNRFTSIGYFLAKNAEGHGIITRCVKRLVQYAFNELRLNRVEIRCGVNNARSRAVPERLGFTQEGMIRQGEKLNGAFHDLLVYSILAKEWHERLVYS